MTYRAQMFRSAAALALLTTPLLAGCGDEMTGDPVEAARSSLDAGEPQTAMLHVVRAIESNPQSAETRMLAGEVSMALGNPDRAISELKRAVPDPQLGNSAKVQLAEAYLASGNLRMAKETLGEAGLENALSYTVGIGLDMAEGNFGKAFATLGEALDKHPNNARLVALDAERLWMESKPGKAKERLRPLFSSDPAIPEAHMLAGQICLKERDLNGAKAHFEKVISVRPAHQTAMLALAAIARDQGDEKAAIKWINAVNKAGPTHPVGLFFTAQMAYDAGDLERANELVEKVPQGFDAIPGFFRLRGMVAAARGQRASAITSLEKYLNNSNGDNIARRVLAQNLAANGELEKAYDVVAPLVGQPNTDGATLLLAYKLAKETGKGNAETIKQVINKRDAAPSFAKSLREAGTAIRAGKWAEADAIFTPLANGEAKDDPVLLNNAAAVKVKLGEYDAAVSFARRAHQLAPTSPEIMDTLGWALWKSGSNPQEARALLSKAKAAAPRNREIFEHWAIAHAKD